MKLVSRAGAAVLALSVCLAAPAVAAGPAGLQPADLSRLKSIGDVHISPDASRVAYAIVNSDRPGRPYSQVWIMNVATGQSTRLGPPAGTASSPRWSADGRFIAFLGSDGQRSGLFVAAADGSNARFIAEVTGTQRPAAGRGKPAHLVARREADRVRVEHARPRTGRERRPDGHHALSLQADRVGRAHPLQRQPPAPHLRRRRRVTAPVRQLTSGDLLRALARWSPSGDRILFVSNREADPDRFFNYDVFTVRVADGSIDRLTATKNAEYDPVYSSDGTADRLPRHEAPAHLLGDDDGGHARVGDERGRQRPARSRRRGGQPAGRAAVDRRRPVGSTSACRSRATSTCTA